MICTVSRCDRQAHSKGLCSMHYQRAKRGANLSKPGRLIASHTELIAFLDDAHGIGCVEWPFGKDGFGYGCITYLGKKTRAHRVQWERHNRAIIPEGMVVRHSCDNASCVNPAHLLIGTQADNIRDQEAHGNKAKGERKGGAKLTDAAVRMARDLRAQGETVKSIAAKFGVHEGTMAQACRGKTWSHVDA